MQADIKELVQISSLPLTTPEARAKLRAAINLLEYKLLKEEQIDPPLIHRFSKDVYAREIFLKKGEFITGKIHKYKNLNIITKGEVSFFSIDGAIRVKAPHTFVASPGVKRVIYAHEDTSWLTIHGTSKTDLKEIEDEVIAKTYDEVPGIDAEELKLLKGELK